MKIHTETARASTSSTFYEILNNQTNMELTPISFDNGLLAYVKDSLDPLREGVSLIHQSVVSSDVAFENRDKKLLKAGIKNCLDKILEECYAYYKEGIKEFFLKEAFNLIQGYIAFEQNKIEASNNESNLSNTNVDERSVNEIYKHIKNTELIKTWDIFYKFLESEISKDELATYPGLLFGFDISKLDFSKFKFDNKNCIDWEYSKLHWKSISITTVQNYLRILEDPVCLIKNLNSAYEEEEEDDDDLKIADGKVSLQCKITLQDFEKPMTSSCNHTFDDKALQMKANETSRFKCLEGACTTNLTYPNDFTLDETMIFRLCCSKLTSKK